ncbi:MAG: carboxypeptidase-like regulatory domain-containing protein, partial [Bacteroidales bacterium]|nr:carboxypeptidase-like regulatory domain-containing protein [Bacteroidales bacterium]
MKAVTLIILIIFAHSFAAAQGPVISGDFSDLPFDEFAREVEEQVRVKFVYRKEWTSDLRISASGDNMELYKILADHLSMNDLYYFFSDDYRIFITRDNPLVTTLPDYAGREEAAGRSHDSLVTRELTEAERLYIEGRRKSTLKTLYIGNSTDHTNGQGAVINGNIKDTETGEAMVGATIYVQELSRGFITDINGYFTMSIPPGSYIFRFNCLGMEELQYKMEVRSSGELDIEMTRRLYPIDEITVKSSEFHNVRGLQMGFTQISIKNIKEI